ncbi:MAG: hypothetical protein J2P25_10460 [Nocardiopsaceae bacterium]|nr:hypothetical protein [Nocardiopsaceae bacterium]
MSGADYGLLFLCVAVVLLVSVRYFFLARARQPRQALTASKEYQALANEYRRLSDMAITANEHVDLRLTDLSVRVDELRDQLDQLQRILKEVE